MTEVAKARATVLRRSLKQDKQFHRKTPSLSDAETYFLRGLLLDDTEPQDLTPHGDSNSDGPRSLSDEMLFSLPPPSNLSGQKSELPAHHKPAKRRSNRGLWLAHEEGFHPNILKLAAKTADSEGKDTSENKGQDSENTEPMEELEDYDDIASDVEVRRDSRSDVSEASSWDEDDHQDNYDTWEVRHSCFKC